jgi:hypothetical protein
MPARIFGFAFANNKVPELFAVSTSNKIFGETMSSNVLASPHDLGRNVGVVARGRSTRQRG